MVQLRLLLGFRSVAKGTVARLHVQLGTEQLEPRALLSATPGTEPLVSEPVDLSTHPVDMPMQMTGHSVSTLSEENVAPILWEKDCLIPDSPLLGIRRYAAR